MSDFWSWYVIFLVVAMLLACAGLLIWTRKYNPNNLSDDAKIDHGFDGIVELNKPLPMWWMWLFWITIIFSVVYLALYPGLGQFNGTKKWSQTKQWQAQVQDAKNQYGPMFAAFASRPIPELAKDEKAMQTGQRLFATHCALCHGSDARGMKGFPNLVEGTWIYGGLPEQIKETIMNGRQAMMPGMMPTLKTDENVQEVVEYLLHLNNRKADKTKALEGEKTFQRVCAVCHGNDAKGKPVMGAPNLTDNTWTHGGTRLGIELSIRNGRQGMMPAHKNIMGEEKVHLMAAYVYSISNKTSSQPTE